MEQLEKEHKISVHYENHEELAAQYEKVLENKYLKRNRQKKWYQRLLDNLNLDKKDVFFIAYISTTLLLGLIMMFNVDSQVKKQVQYIQNAYYQSLDKTNKTIIHDTLVAGRLDTLSDLSATIYHDLSRQGFDPQFKIANDKILVIAFGSQGKIEINLGLSTSIFSYSNLNAEEKEIVIKQLDENNYPGFNIVVIPMENKNIKNNTDITVFIKKAEDIYSNVPNIITIPSQPIGVPLPTLPPMEMPLPKGVVQLPQPPLQVPSIPSNIEDMQKIMKEAPLPSITPNINQTPYGNSNSEYKFGNGKVVPSPKINDKNMKERLDEINKRTNELTQEIDKQAKLLEERNSLILKTPN